MKCCGWVSYLNWTENTELMNRTSITFPCSCKKSDEDDALMMPQKGFCEVPFGNKTQSGNNPKDWPVYQEVRGWLWAGWGRARGTVGSDPPAPSLIWAIAPSTFLHGAVPAFL